jgi:hypothetical protein
MFRVETSKQRETADRQIEEKVGLIKARERTYEKATTR